VFQGIERSKWRERDGEQPVSRAVGTDTTFTNYVCHLIGAWVMAPLNYNSNMKDDLSEIIITNIIK